MGYCSDPPSLIFEYMEKGSLHYHIHKVHITLQMLYTCDMTLVMLILESLPTQLESAEHNFEGLLQGDGMAPPKPTPTYSPGCQTVSIGM